MSGKCLSHRRESHRDEDSSTAQQASRQLRVAVHDLSQPLFSLRVHLMSLRQKIAAVPNEHLEVSALLNSIDQCATAIQWRLESVFQHADVEASASETDYGSATVPIGQLLDAARAVLLPVTRQASVEYRERANSRDLEIPSEVAASLLQILLNLVINSTKYRSTRQRTRSSVIVAVSVLNTRLRLDVVDNGLGMSARELSQAFEYGWRAPASTAINGQGLGLPSVSECLARLPGHKLETSSVLGKGTRFRLVIPYRQFAANSALQSAHDSDLGSKAFARDRAARAD